MWWDRSEPLEIYLSDCVVGFGATGAKPGHWNETSGLEHSLRQAAERLSPAAAPDTRRLRIWLGAGVARPYVVPASSGARSKHEARVLATAMASDATGIDGDVRLWLDHWRVGEATLAVAMPASVWQGLQAIVTTRNASRGDTPRKGRMPAMAIASVRPWWNLPFDELIAQSRSDGSRLGWSLSEGAGILHGVIDRGTVAEIGYDTPGPHDPTGDLLRRRLQVNWGAATVARHLSFERQEGGAEAQGLPVGAWREAAGSVA